MIFKQHSEIGFRKVFLSQNLVTIYVVSCAGLVLFYLLPLDSPTVRLTNILSVLFRLFGHNALAEGKLLIVDNAPYQLEKECTYLDLVLVCIPFLWGKGKGTYCYKLLCMICFGALVSVGNIARAYVAIAGHLKGLSWWLCHDLVDYIAWYGTFALVVVLCLNTQMQDELKDTL